MKSCFLRLTALTLILALTLCLCSCGMFGSGHTINKIDLTDYTIVYSDDAPDYTLRAAEYIQKEILAITGVSLPLCEESEGIYEHEIVVGETGRPISGQLDAQTEGLEFAMLADENHIAMEGDYFVIAAAAYYFVHTYIRAEGTDAVIDNQTVIHTPISEAPRNFIFLIGDGMGFMQTRLFEAFDKPTKLTYYDGEDRFFGYMLPYQGSVMTQSLSGVTDSAASGTALACGVKTYNHYVGKDPDLNDMMSLTELAATLGMSTAVMSTEFSVGATPSAFSAHVEDRDLKNDMRDCQQQMTDTYGTIFDCNLNMRPDFDEHIRNTLSALEEDPDGFFLMYEEAYIDKHSHDLDMEKTFHAVVRFNRAIGLFMEYAFYHPETFLIITADHETCGLDIAGNGSFVYTADYHTALDVPIFAYGQGAEVFHNACMENNEIPKVFASIWAVEDFPRTLAPQS